MELYENNFMFMKLCDDIVVYVFEKIDQRINTIDEQIRHVVNVTKEMDDLESLISSRKFNKTAKENITALYKAIIDSVKPNGFYSVEDVRRLFSIIESIPTTFEDDKIKFTPKLDVFAKLLN